MLAYNPNNKESIIRYAKKLKNKTLRQVCDVDLIKNDRKGKGHFGQILEEFYFHYKLNSDSEPDFPEANLELKSSPIKRLKNQEFRSKERLVLNIINFVELVNQEFETSSFWNKNACLLLVFYLYKADTDLLDYIIKFVSEWSFPDTDLEIIKKDWELIKKKIADGKAHELSEGDTFYLGACTKGASSRTKRKQPFSNIPAKQRAFSLKQTYVNHIIASISEADNEKGIYGKLISNIEIAKKKSIEEVVLERFAEYYGKTIDQIIEETGFSLNKKAKSFYANLTKAILGIALNKKIEEFEKADIVLKSIRVESNDKIIESVSFKKFSFVDIVQTSWEDSDFKDVLEHKFLFIFFKKVNGNRILQKAQFWNMPNKDIKEARKVWLHTKRNIKNGTIVREIKPDGSRKTYFMSKADNPVSHVRPHARNAEDTYPLPKKDSLTKAKEYTKQCFWLNNDYVLNQIYLK